MGLCLYILNVWTVVQVVLYDPLFIIYLEYVRQVDNLASKITSSANMLTHVFVFVLVAQTLDLITAFDCHTQVPEFKDFDIQKVTLFIQAEPKKPSVSH